MEIKTKYNVGDKVWVMPCLVVDGIKAIELEIESIQISAFKDKSPQIMYDLKTGVGTQNKECFKVDEVFDTLDDLVSDYKKHCKRFKEIIELQKKPL